MLIVDILLVERHFAQAQPNVVKTLLEVYFQTLHWQDLRVGTPVHVTIDVPPEMFQLLPFGGLRGFGEVVRVDRADPAEDADGARGSSSSDDPPPRCGIAVRMTTRLAGNATHFLPFDKGCAGGGGPGVARSLGVSLSGGSRHTWWERCPFQTPCGS